jgi:predicted nucleic acid-binding Zn ribbon protein
MSWGPEPIGDEIRRELGRFGPQASMGAIVAAWPKAVGPAIAANAFPARVARDGTLHVATSSSAWAFELTQLEETVRTRLAEHLGKEAPPFLRFAAGRLPERGAEAAPTSLRKSRRAGPTEIAEGARIAARIEDPDLRELVARAAAASLLR